MRWEEIYREKTRLCHRAISYPLGPKIMKLNDFSIQLELSLSLLTHERGRGRPRVNRKAPCMAWAPVDFAPVMITHAMGHAYDGL